MEIAKHTKFLQSMYAINALFSYNVSFRNFEKLCPSDFAFKKTVAGSHTMEENLANVSRELTIGFRMTLPGQLYTALTTHFCSDFIYDRIGIVLDGYISYSESIEDAFDPFKPPTHLGLVYYNDKKR